MKRSGLCLSTTHGSHILWGFPQIRRPIPVASSRGMVAITRVATGLHTHTKVCFVLLIYSFTCQVVGSRCIAFETGPKRSPVLH